MRAYATHTLHLGEEATVALSAREYLALVDVETYPSFVAKDVDHLDMIAHLSAQMRALTAVAWGAPDATLRVRFVVTKSDRTADHVAPPNCHTFASGWVRTCGQLCFTSHNRLFDCAHHRTHAVLRLQRLPKEARPHLLSVPPGVYSVQVFYHLAFPYGGGTSHDAGAAEPKVHFTVILRHYPFPERRVAPIRLPGLVREAA